MLATRAVPLARVLRGQAILRNAAIVGGLRFGQIDDVDIAVTSDAQIRIEVLTAERIDADDDCLVFVVSTGGCKQLAV